MEQQLLKILFLGICVSAMTFTFSVTSIFSKIREWLSFIHPKIEELVNCPFCVSFWLTTLIMKTSKLEPVKIYESYTLNFFLTVFCIMGISAILHFVILRAYEPITRAIIQKKIESLKNFKSQ